MSKTKVCVGSPPGHSVTWSVTLRAGVKPRADHSPLVNGVYSVDAMTAYYAAAKLGLMLSEIDTITFDT